MPTKTAKYAMKTKSTQMAKLTNLESSNGNTGLGSPVFRGRLPATGAPHESNLRSGLDPGQNAR